MRLTLRTLLAWLDDTLPPSQVREIGKQVSESTFAQELVDRIHRVCRQRRLTVPSRTGPEWTDPNIVAGYVDNDLEPEQVTEYEKKCLTSDVNLAEAACVHQILSLLGQKVHVPAEAKARMAQLVKGRESIPKPRTDGVRPRRPEPVTKPIQPWVAPEPPPRPWFERFGPAVACLGLIAILTWSAYQSLTPPTVETTSVALAPAGGPAPQPEASRAEAPAPATPEPAEVSKPVAAAPAGPESEKSPAGESVEAGAKTAAAPEIAPDASRPKPEAKPAARAIPAGAVGVVDHSDGVLIRFNPESREWERVAEGVALANGDRLICLTPFRARILLGAATLNLLGETQLRVLSQNPSDPPAFELIFGRVVLEAAPAAKSVSVECSGQTLALEHASQETVGLEHVARWSYGKTSDQPAPLAIHAPGGEWKLTLGQATRSLAGPGSILAVAGGRLQDVEGKTVPDWVTATDVPEQDRKQAQAFAKVFSPDGHVLADVVSATENESPATKNAAVFAVKALGDLTFLVPILSRPKDPTARRSATAALREFLAQGPDAVRKLNEPLGEEFGDAPARAIQKLLVGYPPEEAAKRETLERLVDHLSPREPSLAVRELALENLKTITGKADQGYDPENPDDKAVAAWKGLLSRGELRPAARRKTAE